VFNKKRLFSAATLRRVVLFFVQSCCSSFVLFATTFSVIGSFLAPANFHPINIQPKHDAIPEGYAPLGLQTTARNSEKSPGISAQMGTHMLPFNPFKVRLIFKKKDRYPGCKFKI